MVEDFFKSSDSKIRTNTTRQVNCYRKISVRTRMPSYSKLPNVLKTGTLPRRLGICSFQDGNVLIK